MPILTFQRRFVAPILAGTKVHTIRVPGRRRHQVGETLYQQTGDRYHPERFHVATCTAVHTLRVMHTTVMIDVPAPGVFRVPPLDLFAQADGFADWDEMSAWFVRRHQVDERPLAAELIQWAPAAWEKAFLAAPRVTVDGRIGGTEHGA